ncbi:MAG: lipopolysaccharide transport periplasmic protein LptA [Alphaproteobacteria bacterium CG_4_10_14_0_8_um_filter_53_9]|nr:MAG: lipopolysaccharide transport periplasmic protein LptA [Alphaproteobacteria bacterium CG_4_10_14_0_8_um_filter_53_9]
MYERPCMIRLFALLLFPFIALAEPIHFDADAVTYTPREDRVVLTGSVHVVQGATTLDSQRLTLDIAQGKPTRMLAEGRVLFTRTGTDALEARGDTATYIPGNETLTLTGNVTLTRAGNTLKGSNLTYDLNTGNAKLTGGNGRVSGQFDNRQD